MTVAERFFEKVAKSEACWEWTAAKDSSGYGRISRTAKGWLQREIAQEMRVSQKQISRILRGENWKQRHSTA